MPWNLKILVKGKLKRDAFHHEPLSSPKSCCLQRSELFQPYFQCGGAMTVVASNWLPSELTGRLRVLQKQHWGGCGYWLPELQNLHIISVLARRVNVELHTSVFGGHVLFERKFFSNFD